MQSNAMSRRQTLTVLAGGAASIAAPAFAAGDRIERLYNRSIVIDALGFGG